MKKGFKVLGLLFILVLGAFVLTGCGEDSTPAPAAPANGTPAETAPETTSTPEPDTFDSLIAVVSREEGSGSRGAFEELVDVNTDEDNLMTADAIIQSGNGPVATFVEQNVSGIGYISLSTLAGRADLVGLYIDGVAPTAENMLSGAYTLVRPFNFVYVPENIGDIERAFIEFAASLEGLDILEAAGVVVGRDGAVAFDAAAHGNLSGSVTFGGSTSTERTAMALAEEFEALFPGVTIAYMAVGSGGGISGAIDGTYALGFASRAIRDTEVEQGINVVQYSVDGLVMAVNVNNPVRNITIAQLRDIYLGLITHWSEVSDLVR